MSSISFSSSSSSFGGRVRLLKCLDVDGCGDTGRCFLRGLGRVVVSNESVHGCLSVKWAEDRNVEFTHFIAR
jgi:hypothetical protein